MWKTIGQDRLIKFLKKSMEEDCLSHAYLLTGPEQVGKMRLALDLAKALNCSAEQSLRPCGECPACTKIENRTHADIQIIDLNSIQSDTETKERTEIGIDHIKDMLHSANLPPFEGRNRIYIIDGADNLSLDAANRLLKILEEPPARVIFILITAKTGLIPATIISRCQKLSLSRAKSSEIESLLIEKEKIEAEKARLLARLSQGCPGKAIDAARNPERLQQRDEHFEKILSAVNNGYSQRFALTSQLALQFGRKRETIYETMDAWESWWRDILLAKTGCLDHITNIDNMPDLVRMAGTFSLDEIKNAIESIGRAEEQLRLNGNARLVLESLMLNIPVSSKAKNAG